VQFTDRAKDDSLEILRNQMVEVDTWVFGHNGLFGEVDRGNVSWTFADSGALTVTDSDETYTRTYSLTKRCGGYGKIGGGNKAYLKIKSSGDLEECYIVNDLVEVGPPEKSLSFSAIIWGTVCTSFRPNKEKAVGCLHSTKNEDGSIRTISLTGPGRLHLKILAANLTRPSAFRRHRAGSERISPVSLSPSA